MAPPGLLLLLPALALAQDCRHLHGLREQMEVEKIAIESKMDKMAATMERIEAEAAQMKANSAQMKAEAEEIQAATVELVKGLARASQPEVMVCSYRLSWTHLGTITYSSILSQFDNCDQPGGGCGAMDIETGTFTAITPGMALIVVSYEPTFISFL